MLCIKLGTMTIRFFYVSNNVRQGGILSPYLFTVYVDDLGNSLDNAGSGCYINNCCANHIMFYADDYIIL